MLDLKKLLGKILNSPFVVEQGTSGIWTYRKWSDGTAECWGKKTVTATITSAWGSLFSGGAAGSVQENYPTNLFISPPTITHSSESNTSYLSWSAAQNSGNATTTPQILLLRGASAGGAQTYTVSICAMGRWK